MFRTQNLICVQETKVFLTSGKKIVSAAYVSRAVKLDKFVSPTVFPSLARPLKGAFKSQETKKLNPFYTPSIP